MDEELRNAFCDEFNRVVKMRQEYLPIWKRSQEDGTALERVRAGQMEEITAGGTILYEVLELTQAVLQEAWMEADGTVRFVFLSEKL